MKHLFNTIFILFSTSLSIFGQIENPNDLYNDLQDDMGIKGNILKLTLSRYRAVNKFGQLEKIGDFKDNFMIYFNQHNKIDTFFSAYDNKKDNHENGRFFHELINNKWLITKITERKHKVEKSLENENIYVDVFKYDKNSNLIEHTKYENDSILRKEIASFNNRNKLLSYKRFDEKGQLLLDDRYTYNDNGKLIQQIKLDSYAFYSNYKYFYNSNGLLDRKLSYEQNGDLRSIDKFYYSSSGILLEEKSLRESHPEFNSVIKYTYNTKGKLINISSYSSNGKKELIESNLYDNSGRLVEQTTGSKNVKYVFNNLGLLENEKTTYYKFEEIDGIRNKVIYHIAEYTFEYDSKGNWIKKIQSHYNIEGKSFLIPYEYTVTERIISYR